MDSKIIIYQIFTRLFSNTNRTCKHNGTIKENGCGKMNGITLTVLRHIQSLNVNYVWYTGIIEHATQTNYWKTARISPDCDTVVKGKAGSPYAIKDYYDVDPDLAVTVDNRMLEFESLIERTHKASLKAIIDFVPNHVARQYHSDSKPEGVEDLGENDNKAVSFSPENNFYYFPEQPLCLNEEIVNNGTEPYVEIPAKATGNDVFSPYPGKNDWYETVKLNYGVNYMDGGSKHFDPIPNTWIKMRDILLFWAGKGVDGFRCDMAEMVPVEFWEWVITEVKNKYKDIIFIAEVYNPDMYRSFIHKGHFDYLYDKVGQYDTLRAVICGHRPASSISETWMQTHDIKSHMLSFLENHDEQRIASDFFAGDPIKARPAFCVGLFSHNNPYMLYFGQEFGERGMDNEGFSGLDGRTTIFDYWSLDTISRWAQSKFRNYKSMTEKELQLRKYYKKMIEISNHEPPFSSDNFFDLAYVNPTSQDFDANKQYAFARYKDGVIILVVANFDDVERDVKVNIPQHLFDLYGITPNKIAFRNNILTGENSRIRFKPEEPIPVKVEANNVALIRLRCSFNRRY